MTIVGGETCPSIEVQSAEYRIIFSNLEEVSTYKDFVKAANITLHSKMKGLKQQFFKNSHHKERDTVDNF